MNFAVKQSGTPFHISGSFSQSDADLPLGLRDSAAPTIADAARIEGLALPSSRYAGKAD